MATSKQPQSGLRTLKRDWSASSSQPSSSQPIPWPLSPPAQAPKKTLSGVEQRLKDIQDALAGNSVSNERKVLGEPSLVVNKKRQSDPTDDGGGSNLPPAKKRTLPPSWDESTSAKKGSSMTRPSGAGPSIARPAPLQKTSIATSKPAPVFLSQEQNQILKLVQEGHSVFYTGSAGTGKSVLLCEIIKTLRKNHIKSPDAVAITASTGIAACNIGGVTIHSFAGIGLGIESAQDLAQKIRKNKKAGARWLRTKVLIIDEVSMVDGDLFDKLAEIGTIIRKKPEPFGGIQVIVTGDFFQLPPVTRGNMQPKFAFEAERWNETIKRTFNLTKVFRQRDQEFVDMLNEMRFGRLTHKSITKFKSLAREIEYDDGLGPTELFPRREDVDRSNGTRMQRLQAKAYPFHAFDGGTTEGQQREKLLSNMMAPTLLVLREDAQVMLIKNMDDTLVNGSMGKVLRFADPTTVEPDYLAGEEGRKGKDGAKKSAVVGKQKLYPVVEFIVPGGRREVTIQPEVWKVELPNGEVQASRTQLPLILAWAMSIHKSQGQTLERVKVDLGKVFEKGQAYVALSRATSLDGLQVLNFDPSKVKAHPIVAEWSKTLETVDLD